MRRRRATGLPALADDFGIEIDALDGAPGVYTADWAETERGRDFVMAMTRAHDELVAKDAPQPWTARFRCTLVLAWPDGTTGVSRQDRRAPDLADARRTGPRLRPDLRTRRLST